jgi:hypothetical protein|tara:strand:+ start:3715 stop:4503 length:789 start_codon:yes stop_codon:yes gene_type:complete
MARTTKLDKGVVRRGVISPDKHFPLHDKGAISCLTKSIEIIKPDFYIDLGDIGEFSSVAHWQWKKKRRPPLEYQLPFVYDDIKVVNKHMDVIDEALDKVSCTEKYLMEGNHDDWLNRFVYENPYLGDIMFKEAMNLDERGYKYFPMGKYLKIGKLYYYHGNHFAGITHARNHLLKLGANVMYGHHHDIQQNSVTHLDGVKSAWSIGCLKDMSDEKNDWLMHRKHNWSHAFAVVDYFQGGLFTVHVVQIINGKTSLWGQLIEG